MAVYTSSQGAVVSGMNTSLPAVADMHSGSPSYLLQHMGGRELENEGFAINGNGATADNVFQVNGICLIHRLQFVAATVTDSTTFSGVQFALYDGTATLDITDVVDGSACISGDYFYKRGLAATAMIKIDVSVGAIAEAAANKVSYEPFFVGKKSAADTFIQLLYTGDADTDITANFEVYYTPASHGASLTAV